MKIAILGLGAAARHIHIPAYERIAGLEIVGGYDITPPGYDPGFPVFDSLDELFRRTAPDIVTIATPTDSHYKLALHALENRSHVFCEKPFTSTLENALDLIEAADRYDRKIAVNNEFRFMNCHQAAKDRIEEPDFGELLFVDLHQTFVTNEDTEAGWRGQDPQRTCKEFGIHVLDLCRFFFAAEPLTVDARMPRPGRKNGPDYLNLIDLEFSGDRYAHITLDRLCKGEHRYLDIRLDGTRACVKTSLGGKLAVAAGINAGTRRPFVKFDFSLGGCAEVWTGESRRKIASDPLDLFARATSKLMDAFVTSIRVDSVPPCSARDNLNTLALMLAAYESAGCGRPVDVAAFIRDRSSGGSTGRRS